MLERRQLFDANTTSKTQLIRFKDDMIHPTIVTWIGSIDDVIHPTIEIVE